MSSVLSIKKNTGGGWVELPMPAYKGYSVVKNSMYKAERTVGEWDKTLEVFTGGGQYGYLKAKLIADKYEISVSWVGLTNAEKNLIISMTECNNANGNLFGVRFYDMTTGSFRTIGPSGGYASGAGFYRGNDFKISGYGTWTENDGFQHYDLSMSLIER